MLGTCNFAATGATVWNTLQANLIATLVYDVTDGVFQQLKSFLYAAAWLNTGIQHLEHYADTARHSVVVANTTAHFQNWADGVQLFSLQSTLCSCTHHACTFASTVCRPHDLVVPRMLTTRFDCHIFHVCGPTIWSELFVNLQSNNINWDQFKCSHNSWVFGCAYSRGAFEKQFCLKERLGDRFTYLLCHACPCVNAVDAICVLLCRNQTARQAWTSSNQLSQWKGGDCRLDTTRQCWWISNHSIYRLLWQCRSGRVIICESEDRRTIKKLYI